RPGAAARPHAAARLAIATLRRTHSPYGPHRAGRRSHAALHAVNLDTSDNGVGTQPQQRPGDRAAWTARQLMVRGRAGPSKRRRLLVDAAATQNRLALDLDRHAFRDPDLDAADNRLHVKQDIGPSDLGLAQVELDRT